MATAKTADAPKGTKLEIYMDKMLPEQKAAQLYLSLPQHIKPEAFKRNIINALMNNPDLLNFSESLVYREISKSVSLGLLLDPHLGEAYIIVGWNGKTKQKEPQLRIGYKGIIKLARQSGNVAGVWAHEVREHDSFVVEQGFPKSISHKPKAFGDRGDVIGYFAVITYRDGTCDFETMSADECHAIRDRSDAWKAFVEKKIKSTPWSTDDVEMCKKTVMRRLGKRQDQSPELRTAIRIEDEAEFPHMIEVDAPQMLTAPTPPEDPDADKNAPQVNATDVRRKAPEPTAEGAAPKSTRAERQAKPKAVAAEEARGEPEKTTAKVSLPSFKTPEDMLAHVQKLCDAITVEQVSTDDEYLQRFWDNKIAPLLVGAFPPDVDEVQAIWKKANRRLEP